jgi:hypothetical protein
MLTDEDIRQRLAPLAALEPTEDDLAALRAAPRPRPRRRPRAALVLTAAATAAAAAIALAPAAREPERSPEPPLVAAAAIAAQRSVPTVDDAPYRYTRTRNTLTYEVRRDRRVGGERYEIDAEAWVGARWRGREIGAESRRALVGDIALAREQFGAKGHPFEAYDRPYAYGDGPLARLDPRTLPQDRKTLARVLTTGIRTDRWGPYASSRGRPLDMPEDLLRSVTAHHTILLLVHARLTPVQRAALLDMLAAEAPARDLGTVTDAIGRRGRGVALSYPIGGPIVGHERYRIVFDPATAEVLEWAHEPPDGASRWAPHRVETVIETGWARRVGERP